MASGSSSFLDLPTHPLESSLPQPHWYVLYTRSRFEKKLMLELTERQTEVFLPMREILSRWKDRKKKVWKPLFPGYIFVNQVDTPENRYRVLNVPGAVRFIESSFGHPEAVPEDQILAIRRLLETSLAVDPYPYMQAGTQVEVTAGPFAGLRGILTEKRGKFIFVVQLDMIQQAVSVVIDAADVKPI